MRILFPQATLFCGFALGLAGLLTEMTHGSSHRECFGLCCGMVPALSAALLVLLVTGCCRAVRRHTRTDSESQQPLGWCVVVSTMAAIVLSVKASPLVCSRVCGECGYLNAGSVGICAFFFSLIGAAAGATIVTAGEMAAESGRQAARPLASDAAPSTPPATGPLRPQRSTTSLAARGTGR